MSASTIHEEAKPQGALASLLEANTDKLLTCVHCGLCLPACPTYQQLGNENDSPRGRIYLMRGVVEGRLGISDSFTTHIDLCLGCRACETVCPSGVPYGHLLEAARFEVAKASSNNSTTRRLIRFVLNQVFTRPRMLRFALMLARWLRDSGLARALLRARLIRGRSRFALALLIASRSPLSGAARRQQIGQSLNDDAMSVATLNGCVMHGLFQAANRATKRVLARNGCRLIEAEGQGCCGALHAHAGELGVARQLARRNIEAFLASGVDWIIVNAAGCGAAMKEYGSLLADDPLFADRAAEISSRVKDVSEFLIERGFAPPTHSINKRVAYDAPCHLIHAQRIAEAPIEVLRSIPGLTIVPLRAYENCCGGAGIYNLQHAELSAEILSDKLASLRESGAEIIATSNPGCIMQIGAGVLLNGLTVGVIHPIELLDAAYGDQ
jgi:glycolate oxidase iron-sulfur subunit